MKNTKLCGGLILLVAMLLSATAYADRPRGHGGRSTHSHIGIGLYFGSPYYYPYSPHYPYLYYPYSYYIPPEVLVPMQPPTYVEQLPSEPQQSSPEKYYWYYCEKYEGYYPYIKNCPDGWQRVPPSPPAQP